MTIHEVLLRRNDGGKTQVGGHFSYNYEWLHSNNLEVNGTYMEPYR